MFFEMTVQIRVADFSKGQKWYETLLKREPDFIPHDGFAEWELLPECWLQVGEGTPAYASGPLRLGVKDIEFERERVIKELSVETFEIYTREEIPVKWGTFIDPWGNHVGFFEYLDKNEEKERIRTILDIKETTLKR